MGNTKQITWFGDFKRKGKIDFDKDPKKDVMNASHGTYVGMRHHRGTYLKESDFSDTEFFMGTLHTYSIVGANLVNVLLEQMVWGDVLLMDHDMPMLLFWDKQETGEVKNYSLEEGMIERPFIKIPDEKDNPPGRGEKE